MIKQWRVGTKGLSKREIETKFRLADTNGNGRLNAREFQKLLISFGIKVSSADQYLLLRRFDVDGDGELDLLEFHEFIDKYINITQESEGGNGQDRARNDMSLSSTVPYDAISGKQQQQTLIAKDENINLTVDYLFEKQNEIEKKLGEKYYSGKKI